MFQFLFLSIIRLFQDIKGAGVIKKVILSLNMLIFHEGKNTVTLYDISSTLDNLSMHRSDAININSRYNIHVDYNNGYIKRTLHPSSFCRIWFTVLQAPKFNQ